MKKRCKIKIRNFDVTNLFFGLLNEKKEKKKNDKTEKNNSSNLGIFLLFLLSSPRESPAVLPSELVDRRC